jgi:hypothetical protein
LALTVPASPLLLTDVVASTHNPGWQNWIKIGFVIAFLMFPRPNSLINGTNPGGTNSSGGRP